ncbi:DEAD/DEAH box helicase [Candidatus Peregrinibacteria bacterium]|nr:MAG: DEAD/DEAH box helicase [Candidatus Peregrinibacteria bacterium]
MNLETPISSVISTKPEYLKALEEMGVHTLEDLLLYFPKSYEDLSEYKTLDQVQNGEKVTVKGFFQHMKAVPTKGKISLTKADFFDHEGNPAEAVWFNQSFVRRMIPMDTQLVVTAKIQRQYGKVSLQSPMVETAGGGQVHSGGLIPVYPQHAVITSKWLREKINPLLVYAKEFEECLPEAVIQEEDLMGKEEAVQEIHFPTSQKRLQKAKDRLAYEELFLLQLNAVQRKKEWQESAQKNGHHHEVKMDVNFVKNFFSTLPFAPTGAQKVAIYEILQDFEKPYPMMRLLEGDVGSGKTVVAAIALLNAVVHGQQAAIMAPTEVLARQHMVSITQLIEAYEAQFPLKRPINIQLLVGSLKPKEKAQTQQGDK